MSGVFAIGPSEMAAIKAAYERARAKPIPWEVLRGSIPENQGPLITLADRKRKQAPRDPEQVLLPFGYRLAITFEQQPAGLIAHFSLSTSTPGRLPHPMTMAIVFEACGLAMGKHEGSTWVEEFEIDGKPGGKAVNVAVVVGESNVPCGHA